MARVFYSIGLSSGDHPLASLVLSLVLLKLIVLLLLDETIVSIQVR